MLPQRSQSGSQPHPKKKQQQAEPEQEDFWQPLSTAWRREKQTAQAARARSRSSAPHIQQAIYAAPWQADQVILRYHRQGQPQPKKRPHPRQTPPAQQQVKEEEKQEEENDSSSTEIEVDDLAQKLLEAETRWEAQQLQQQQQEDKGTSSSSNQNAKPTSS